MEFVRAMDQALTYVTLFCRKSLLIIHLTLLCSHQSVPQDIPNTAVPAKSSLSTIPPSVTDFISTSTEFPFPQELGTSSSTVVSGTRSHDRSRDDVSRNATMETLIVTEIAGTEFVTDLENISSTELVTKVRSLCCPIGYADVNGSCYIFRYDEVGFEEAQEMCRFYDEGSSLAKIELFDDLGSYLPEELRYYSDVSLIWVGLVRDENNSYTWIFDDTPLNTSHWAAGQPSMNESLSCVAVNREGTWALQSCSASHPFLCQSSQIYCGELTTAPDVTTDEFTTAEITEVVTNATTMKATTTPPTTLSTTLSTTLPTTLRPTTTKPRKIPTTVDMDDDATTEEVTESIVEEEDETTEEPTEGTTKKITTRLTTSTGAPSTPFTQERVSLSSITLTDIADITSLRTKETSQPFGTGPPASSSVGEVTVTMEKREPTDGAVPGGQTSQGTTPLTTTVTRTPLGTINKILISIIVIFTVLAILIGIVILYLLRKRKQAKKGVYDVDGTELDDIRSVEDIAGPSTSSDGASDVTGGIASTSFVNDELPGFSGGHFSGLRGKTYSYDIT